MQVWIMSKGEDFEEGFEVGVYTSEDEARAAFRAAAMTIDGLHPSCRLDEGHVRSDGTIRVHGGCDWLELTPCELSQEAVDQLRDQLAEHAIIRI